MPTLNLIRRRPFFSTFGVAVITLNLLMSSCRTFDGQVIRPEPDPVPTHDPVGAANRILMSLLLSSPLALGQQRTPLALPVSNTLPRELRATATELRRRLNAERHIRVVDEAAVYSLALVHDVANRALAATMRDSKGAIVWHFSQPFQQLPAP